MKDYFTKIEAWLKNSLDANILHYLLVLSIMIPLLVQKIILKSPQGSKTNSKRLKILWLHIKSQFLSQLTICQNVSGEEKMLIYIKLPTINYNLPHRNIVIKIITFFILY